MTVPISKRYTCAQCAHAFYRHRESREWQLLNSRRKRNLKGCTVSGCSCETAS